MNPYVIDEPACILFSGGRTSAFLLYKVLEAHGGKLPSDVKVTFANTGKEMPQTLDFVQACSDNWGVDIVWLEYAGRSKAQSEGKKIVYDYRYNIVDHKTASRNGEPFAQVIADVGNLPNPSQRWCSGQLKIRTIKRYLIDQGFETPFLSLVGLRADEPRRAAKLHGKINEGQEVWCPMYVAGETKESVGAFWKKQNFDLSLPNNNGVTDLGNCDLCFLKSRTKRLSAIRERPELAEWWEEQEKISGDQFDRKGLSYKEMIVIASDQGNLFDFDDPSISCFCGD